MLTDGGQSVTDEPLFFASDAGLFDFIVDFFSFVGPFG